ncbi:hypothetical protein BDV97DRAFT_111745 [Delphinella strobiligena]|nr:hypothetical protein BDV97DRAFT_111745 [Delphinella strobiligena]
MLSLIKHLRTASTEEVNKLLRRDRPETTDATGSQAIKRHQSHDDMETSQTYSGSGSGSGSSWNTQDRDNSTETTESRQTSTAVHERMEGMVKVEGTPLDRADLTIPQSFTISLPRKEVFEIATTSYNRAIGQMFYMYTPEQVSKLMDDVFGTGDSLQNATSLGQLCAIAALGSFYADDSVSTDDPQTFYSMAKMFVDDVIENNSLDGMKMCAILGFVNILTKSTMTIVFLERGCSLAQKSGLLKRIPPDGMAPTQWLDYKRTWRTLVSCLAWVSATLGVVLNSDWQASYAALQESDLDNTDVSELAQLEMAKIATLKANMIGDIATFKTLPKDVISKLQSDLGDWHAQLPDTMHLTNLLQRGIAEEPRLQVLFLHLLYLGAIMLFSRCIMSHGISDESDPSASEASSDIGSNCIRDGYDAARQSARVLDLLKEENGAVKRCWVCIYQSYIAGILLIQESFMLMLHRAETKDGLEERIAIIAKSRDVLEYCGTEDAVAQELLSSLETYFASLKAIQDIGVDAVMDLYGAGPSLSRPTFSDYVTIASDSSTLHVIARELLALVRQPFPDLSTYQSKSWRKTRTIAEPVYGVHLDWDWGAVQRTDKATSKTQVESRTETAPLTTTCNQLLKGMHGGPIGSFVRSKNPIGWATDAWGNMEMHDASLSP